MRGACLWLAVLRTCAFPTLYKSNKGRHVCDLQLMCVVLSGVVCTGHRHAGKPSRFEIWQSSKWTLWTCCCLSNCPSLGLPEFWWILVSALFLVVAHRCNPLDFDWVLTSSHCDSHKAATDLGDQNEQCADVFSKQTSFCHKTNTCLLQVLSHRIHLGTICFHTCYTARDAHKWKEDFELKFKKQQREDLLDVKINVSAASFCSCNLSLMFESCSICFLGQWHNHDWTHPTGKWQHNKTYYGHCKSIGC